MIMTTSQNFKLPLKTAKPFSHNLPILLSSASLYFFPMQRILCIKEVRRNKPDLGARPVNSATQDTGSHRSLEQMALFMLADFISTGASLRAVRTLPRLCFVINQFPQQFSSSIGN